ncbi:DUF167 family protein [Rhodospirillum sp. A1_3_36]|uniref:DUF167 family protein n=1 Tax=Rhodospirillum sp. A1_3_36 TaxID=3391666 RepID=UPI0039A713D9
MDPLTDRTDGLWLTLRLTPKASRDALVGITADADGSAVLKASVTAVPENGKANAALVKLLAKSWKLPKGTLSVIQGQTDRRKVLRVEGDPGDLRARLDPLIAALPRV